MCKNISKVEKQPIFFGKVSLLEEYTQMSQYYLNIIFISSKWLSFFFLNPLRNSKSVHIQQSYQLITAKGLKTLFFTRNSRFLRCLGNFKNRVLLYSPIPKIKIVSHPRYFVFFQFEMYEMIKNMKFYEGVIFNIDFRGEVPLSYPFFLFLIER